MPNFLLLLHQSPTKFASLAPEEIQRIVGKYIAWREDIVKRGHMRGGEKLTDDGGQHVKIQNGKIAVTDGPFSEASEILGGYFLIQAANYADAVVIAQTCPHLAGEQWVEVRQIAELH